MSPQVLSCTGCGEAIDPTGAYFLPGDGSAWHHPCKLKAEGEGRAFPQDGWVNVHLLLQKVNAVRIGRVGAEKSHVAAPGAHGGARGSRGGNHEDRSNT